MGIRVADENVQGQISKESIPFAKRHELVENGRHLGKRRSAFVLVLVVGVDTESLAEVLLMRTRATDPSMTSRS